MNTVKFGTKDSFSDFGLLLTAKTIGTPEIKRMEVDVPGRDGTLDLTEYFGAVHYSNRELTFEFSTTAEHYARFVDFVNVNHGKKIAITLSEDPTWIYTGRISVGEFTWEKGIGSFTVTCDCNPYKTKGATKKL